MSNSAWCDLNSKGDILQLHEKCPNPKCNCQKSLLLLHIITCSRADQSKLIFKTFLEEHKLLGKNF